MKTVDDVVRGMTREVELQKEFLGSEVVETIYLGGGTPSLLSPPELKSIFQMISSQFTLDQNVEMTIEVNPDDVNKQNLEFWQSLGINRLSIGIQSFDDDTLDFMNRVHNSQEALKAIELSREHGFDNLNIDLIFGVDESDADHQRLVKDLEILKTVGPEHVSAYALTIEPRTVFGHRVEKGEQVAASNDYVSTEFEMVMSHLRDSGFEHYEVSNYARPGFRSKHNSSYWVGKPYLGIGPGAHSFDGEHRYFNVENNAAYVRALQIGELASTRDILTRDDRINEYILTGLRTIEGISLEELSTKFQYTLPNQHRSYLNELEANGFAEVGDQKLILTEKGFMHADSIAAHLFIV